MEKTEKGYRQTENSNVVEVKRLERLRKIGRTPETKDTQEKQVEEEDLATSGAITVARWATLWKCPEKALYSCGLEKYMTR